MGFWYNITMASRISKGEIKKLGLLSRVAINEKETKEFQQDMEKILVFVSKLSNCPTSDVGHKTSDVKNVMREDDPPAGGLDKKTGHDESLLKQAPEIERGFVKTRKTL